MRSRPLRTALAKAAHERPVRIQGRPPDTRVALAGVLSLVWCGMMSRSEGPPAGGGITA